MTLITTVTSSYLHIVDNDGFFFPGNSSAHLAAQEGHLGCLKFLLASLISAEHVINARNDDGETPADLASRFYKFEVFEFLANFSKNREKFDGNENQNLAFPAHVAAFNGDLMTLQTLVEQGIVNIDEQDDRLSTAAHKAAGQGHEKILEWLIEMGADMQIRNCANETALEVASRFAQLSCVLLLGGETPDDDVIHRDDAPGLVMSQQEEEDSKERAFSLVEDLEEKLEKAKNNFRQFGGELPEDKKRKRDRDDTRRELKEKLKELEDERIRREELEEIKDLQEKEILKFQEIISNLSEQLENANEVN